MQSLHSAIEAGDEKQIAEILSKDFRQISARNALGNTPLHSAVYQEQEGIVRLLLGAGADVNAVGQEGETPLHTAVRTDQPELVELLLTFGAGIEAKNSYGWTPLQWAIRANREIAEQLLSRGASLDLLSAVALGKASDVKRLLHDDAPKTSGSPSPEGLLDAAIVGRSPEILELLLSNGVCPSNTSANRSPFFTAIEQALPERDLSLVDLLLKYGLNPNVKNDRNESLLQFVKKYGTEIESPNPEDRTWGQRVYKYLVDRGAVEQVAF
jgi:ankyrin repeat protein